MYTLLLGECTLQAFHEKSSWWSGVWHVSGQVPGGQDPAALCGPGTGVGARAPQQKGWGTGGQDEGHGPSHPTGSWPGLRPLGAPQAPFLPALYQPRLISSEPGVPCSLFNDNCILLICQPFIKVFPWERQRQKISNLFIRSTNYPNWMLHLHSLLQLPLEGRVGWWDPEELCTGTREKDQRDPPSRPGVTCSKLFKMRGLVRWVTPHLWDEGRFIKCLEA